MKTTTKYLHEGTGHGLNSAGVGFPISTLPYYRALYRYYFWSSIT